MKKYIMLVSAMALLVPDVFAMNKSSKADQSSVSNITRKQKLKRVDSRARLPILKDKDQLPAPMSTEEYIDMLKKFLNENNQLIDPKELIERLDLMKKWSKGEANWMSDLQRQFSFNPKDYPEYKSFINEHEALFYQREEQTNPHLPKDAKIIDISCPNIMIWAFVIIAENKILEENPTDISSDQHLNWKHFAWIVKYFAKHVNKIQSHEIDPDDKYDSGLTDEEIDLLIKLSVGSNRVFDISEMSESEQDEFTNSVLKDTLRNATGFQRILSLLITSIRNYNLNIQNKNTKYMWQAKVSFVSNGKSERYKDRIYLDKLSLTYWTFFHEATHLFHAMIGLSQSDFMNLQTNISIVNSRDINLLDQCFPMLRPSVMNPILKQIENLIDRYWGHDFEKITEEERQRLVVVVLEPVMRRAMITGFGNFIFPDYKTNQSLKMSINMLTTRRMAMCMYLSGALKLDAVSVQFAEVNSPLAFLPSNVLPPCFKGRHPIFKTVEIMSFPDDSSLSLVNQDCLWTSHEERLTMQGGNIFLDDGTNLYIQDRQNEHIYRIRSQAQTNTSYSTKDQFRYHNFTPSRSASFRILFSALINCCPSLNEIHKENIKNSKQLTDLEANLEEAFLPSSEIKYAIPEYKLQTSMLQSLLSKVKGKR